MFDLLLRYRVAGDSGSALVIAVACPALGNALPIAAEALPVTVESHSHGQWGSGKRREKQAGFRLGTAAGRGGFTTIWGWDYAAGGGG